MDIVALVSVIGITLSGVLTTLFTSRCKNIDCCWGGIVCERKVKGDNDNDDVEDTVFTKTEQHDVSAEDSDEEESTMPEIVADESATQEAAVEEEAPAPKKKVMKKKVAEPVEEEAPAPKKKVVKKKKVVAEESA